ncbi:helix-turn-helix domain-containing protein, partial [Gordonia sp. HY002]|uniref:helix-turn-helix domain-containing protein n=1 Tax=Gordonia zhenghanii TaxID=2911516 RepID=UPI001EEFC385
MDRFEQCEKAVRWYGAGVPAAEIASLVGVAGSVQVYALLQEAGYRAGIGYGPRTIVTDDEVIAAYLARGSIKQAARVAAISQAKTRRILVEAGLVPAVPRPYRRWRVLERAPWDRGPGTAPETESVMAREIAVLQSAITEQVNPCTLSSPSRLLTLADRLVIADGLIHHWSYARIGTAIGKHKSTVSREVRNHSVNGHYLPYQADH